MEIIIIGLLVQRLEEFCERLLVRSKYVEYEIHYSLSDEIEIKNEVQEIFDYVVISKTENIIRAYQQAIRSFILKRFTSNIPTILQARKNSQNICKLLAIIGICKKWNERA